MSENNRSGLDNMPIEIFSGLMFILLFVVAGYFYPIIWKGPWAAFRYIEIQMVLLIPISDSLYEELAWVKYTLQAKDWAQLNYTGMVAVDKMMFPITGWIYCVGVLTIIGKRLLKPTYKKHLDYEQLLNELSQYYRFARCMIALNPLKEMKEIDVTKSAFAIRQSPKTYMVSIGAVQKVRLPGSSVEYLYLDKQIAHNKMISQLGRRHQGWESYTNYERWLIAAFMCYIGAKKYGDESHREGDDILGDASYYFNNEMPDTKVTQRANAAIERHCNHPEIIKIEKSHAFTTTTLRQLFHITKTRGIHPAFHFSWLYTVDRTLALLLNETGMPNERGGGIEVGPPESCIEAFYPRIHWINEVKSKSRLLEPTCRYALEDVEEYLIKLYRFKREEDVKEMISGIDDVEKNTVTA